MNVARTFRSLMPAVVWSAAMCMPASWFAAAASADAVHDLAQLGVRGGLVVQLGGDDQQLAASLARTGRFLVHAMWTDDERCEAARRRLLEQGLYGLADVEVLGERDRLPFTENLVNVVIVTERSAAPPLDELDRVLSPQGLLLASADAYAEQSLRTAGWRVAQGPDGWLAAYKPRPEGMDAWTHPRHSADGNPVSQDTLVGPPQRVRWVVAAEVEAPDLVVSERHSIYGAALVRDSFNGLRLWARDLMRGDAPEKFALTRLSPDDAPPVAAGTWLLAVDQGRLSALDAATGEVLRRYETAEPPRAVLHDAGIVISVGRGVIEALALESAELLWRREADEPRSVVAGGQIVAYLEGQPRRGVPSRLVALDKQSGDSAWMHDDLPWLDKASRLVYHDGLLACEVSSWNDEAADNSLHLLRADSGQVLWDREFLPGMNHRRQARAMFVASRLWVLQGGRDAEKNRLPIECAALELTTGQPQQTFPAGLAHCFPPVATARYLLAGELDFTDLSSGTVTANRITKASCSADHGWVPANGLVYVTPKHCTCWPMLRGFAALAPQRPSGGVEDMPLGRLEFPLEKGPASPPQPAIGAEENAWPCYRHDAWRSGGSQARGPAVTELVWNANLAPSWPAGPIVADWRENPFVKGPVTAPVVAGGNVYVAVPDAHQVVALDAGSGQERWRFTAAGRVDTAPTIHRGLCLFGSKHGWVYCLRADNGQLVWRRRCAPLDERMVAYGQVESPWPVPGSVLVIDDTAYFAAGRQPLADGGIFVFAADPASGELRWVQRLDNVPQQGFYENSALEFDNFDLLHREGDGVAMSRWVFNRTDGEMKVDKWRAFARLDTGGGSAMVPQGSWSYAPRYQARIPSHTPRRPLVVFRDHHLWGCLHGMKSIYRRDFNLEGGEEFDDQWITGWEQGKRWREGQIAWRSHRLAENATWKVDVYGESEEQSIAAMALAGDQLWLAGSQGDLRVVSAESGELIARRQIPSPLWDGLAVAYGRIYVTTAEGHLMCWGGK